MAKLRGRYRAGAHAEINITPLIDVMLVLLMILMLAAPAVAHQVDVTIKHPAPPLPVPPPSVTVAIAADGTIRWDGHALAGDVLAAEIAHAARRDPQPVIEIDAHDATPYEIVVALAARLDRAGIETMGFRPRR